MERKIEVRRKDAESLDASLLLGQLSNVFGLRDPNSIEYQEGSVPGLGTLILRAKNSYDVQEVGYLISFAGYAVIPSNFEVKPSVNNFEQIAKMFSNLRERLKQGNIRMIGGLEEKRDCNGLLRGSVQ